MKKQEEMVILRLLSLSLILLIGFSGFSQDRPVRGTAIEKIVAKVDNYIILKSDLEARYLAGLRDGLLTTANGRCRALESLVNEKLLVAKAEIDSVEVPEDQIQSDLSFRLGAILQQIGGNEADLVRQFGKTMPEIRAELYDDIKEQAMQDAMQAEIVTDVKVSPAEVKAFFDAIPMAERPFYSAEIKLGVIEKLPEASKETKDKTRARLNVIRERIVSGEATFEEMALEHSMDGAARNGGNLGFYSRGGLDPRYEGTAMKMRTGEISPVIETDFGFNIIKLIERRGDEYNSSHIILIPEPDEEDKKKAIATLDSIRGLVMDSTYTWAEAAKEFSDDKNTSDNGGIIQGRYGNFVSVDDEAITPDVFLTIDTMQIGLITRPLSFRKDEPGAPESFRIFFYMDRISPHQANLEQDYEKIYNAALAKKRDETLEAWLQRSRKEVFIEIADEYKSCSWVDKIFN
jgi:peptidyl-prolyl cis-trans isomerase SurA